MRRMIAGKERRSVGVEETNNREKIINSPSQVHGHKIDPEQEEIRTV